MGLIARGLVLLVILGALFGTYASAQPLKAPYVITTPGIYELSEDIRGLTDIYGIKIECSNVILDGGNHFLGGESREKSIGVYVNKYGGSITNVTVKNLILESWSTGVEYNYVKGESGDSNLIAACDIVKSTIAVHIQSSDHVIVSENRITDSSTGIKVDDSTSVTLEKNSVSGSALGVSIYHSPDSIIDGNNINTCEVYGLEVINSDKTAITKNAISDNKYAAIRLENLKKAVISSNNLSKTEIGPVLILGNEVRETIVTDNIFASYENVAVDEVSSEIVWNATQVPGVNILGGPYLGGNYWGAAVNGAGFSDTAPDEDGFGISDKPYQINEYNTDYLPLTYTTATKAPEEQIEEPVIIESDETEDSSEPEIISQEESEEISSATQPDMDESEDNRSDEPVPDINITSDLEQNTLTQNNTPEQNKSENMNLTQIYNSDENSTMDVSVLTPTPDSDVLNRSITNAYPSEDEENSANISEETSSADSAEAGNSSEQVIIDDEGDINQTITPASVGYLVFTTIEPGLSIILTTTTGKEVVLDPMENTNVTVSVPIEGLTYTTFRAEKEGINQSYGMITPYPGPGQTVTIPVVINQTPASQPKAIITPFNVSNITQDTALTPQVTEVMKGNQSQANTTIPNPLTFSTPLLVVSNDEQPAPVTNGVEQNTSGKNQTIRASAGPGGAIFPSGSVQVQNGGSVAFIIDPNEGRKIAYLVVDGVKTSPMSEYRFINVNGDHTIVAGFV
jgi:parallel beta-helix repeat protein